VAGVLGLSVYAVALPLTDAEKDAVVGAVRPVIDAEMEKAAPAKDGR